jgi:hypothetical protein
MSFTIDGTIVPGFGAADPNMGLQLPHFILVFPEIKRCRPGTINLQLDQPLQVNNPHYTTPPIRWTANAPPEQFSFLRIEFECPIGSPARRAWIYIPHYSPHRSNLFLIEVIAEPIPEAAEGVRCRLRVSDQHRTSEVLIV